jgi:flagellar biosynthesis/type III secretory pathway protein FliH
LSGDLHHTITTYVFEQVKDTYRQPLLTAIEGAVYTEQEGTRMRSIADSLREEGMMTGLEQGLTQGIEQGLTQGIEQGLTQGREQGLEQGKADVLVRLLRRRFGLTEEEEAIVRDCHDAERLDEAAEACVDPEAGKDEILALLK